MSTILRFFGLSSSSHTVQDIAAKKEALTRKQPRPPTDRSRPSYEAQASMRSTSSSYVRNGGGLNPSATSSSRSLQQDLDGDCHPKQPVVQRTNSRYIPGVFEPGVFESAKQQQPQPQQQSSASSRARADLEQMRQASSSSMRSRELQQQVPSSSSRNSSNSSSSRNVSLPVIPSSGGGKLCCDKCDGKHVTEDCPHYRRGRDTHPDAQKNFYKKLGGTSTLPGQTLSARSVKVIRQPGDGSCLFHSLSFGLDGPGAGRLRAEICDFIRNNPGHKICDVDLSDWIKWDSGGSCAAYASKMARGSWGGGIEMAVASHIKGVNVHVYQSSGFTSLAGYKRICAFDSDPNPERRRCVRVLYQGGVHYDALV